MRADRLRFGPSRFSALSIAVRSNSFAIVLLALGCASGWSACDRPAPWTQHAFASRTSPADPTDVPMPSALWYELIGVPAPPSTVKSAGDEAANAATEAQPQVQAEEKSDSKSGDPIPLAAKVGIETELKPMAIYLIEEVRGTLGGKHHRIEFGPGGGAIDLRDFVTQDRGAFRLVFEFDPRTRTEEETKAEADFERKVLFYSNGKRRRSQQGTSVEWVGDGCDHWLDVTRSVLQAAKGEGLLFAVADARHVSALAGTFFFSVKSPKAPNLVQLARVSFYDSSRRALLCRI
ncbi:MAG TPA: hypothetical protein PLZ57_04385 [Pseudobdellovibrionaceae bacterium]|nr:hypothetical protein [Pseudobdellovibrionaceae bacterium]